MISEKTIIVVIKWHRDTLPSLCCVNGTKQTTYILS